MHDQPTSHQEWEVVMDDVDVDGLLGLRERAHRVLAGLEQGRELTEQRAAETGRRDPMKFVTGRSALETAISATREMIRRMDSLLAQCNGKVNGIERDALAVNGTNGLSGHHSAGQTCSRSLCGNGR